jgi:hypothetical protein
MSLKTQGDDPANYTLDCSPFPHQAKTHIPGGNQFMKLFVHASILSVVFAGFVASALTTKVTGKIPANHSLIVSHAMPVPSCDPATGCAY